MIKISNTSKLMREQCGHAENVARVCRSFATKVQENLNLEMHLIDIISLKSLNDQVAEFDARILILQLTAINMDTDINDIKTIFDILKSVNMKARHSKHILILLLNNLL